MEEINKWKIFLMISLTNFSNLNLMTSEQIVAIHHCDGCKSSPDSNKIDYNNICEAISRALTFLESLIETLLSPNCISAVSKIDLASDSGTLAQIMRSFLITRFHTINPIVDEGICGSRNHIIIDKLSEISNQVKQVKVINEQP